MKDYKYQCIDESLLTPWFRRSVVARFLPVVPWRIPANFLTLTAIVPLIAAWHIVRQSAASTSGNAQAGGGHAVLAACCIFAYALLDHLDGMQAKRTGTSSALGEFCDHFLDVFATGLVSAIVMSTFKVTTPWVIGAVFFSVYAFHAGTIYEQLRTGWLRFERIGSLEALVLAMGFLLISMSPVAWTFLTVPRLFGVSAIEAVLLASALGGAHGLWRIRARIGAFGPRFVLFVFAGMVWALSAFRTWDVEVAAAMVALWNAAYISGLMRAHLVDGYERWADVLSVAALATCTALAVPIKLMPYAVYLGAVTVWHAGSVVYALREFWLWYNPRVGATVVGRSTE